MKAFAVTYKGSTEGVFATRAEAVLRLFSLKSAVAVPWQLAIVEVTL